MHSSIYFLIDQYFVFHNKIHRIRLGANGIGVHDYLSHNYLSQALWLFVLLPILHKKNYYLLLYIASFCSRKFSSILLFRPFHTEFFLNEIRIKWPKITYRVFPNLHSYINVHAFVYLFQVLKLQLYRNFLSHYQFFVDTFSQNSFDHFRVILNFGTFWIL